MTGARVPAAMQQRPGRARRPNGVVVAAAVAAAAAMAAAGGAWATSPAAGGSSAAPKAVAKNTNTSAQTATAAALGDLGLALLRDAPGVNAVVSPLAVATVLGMVQSGTTGATEREIEALFGSAIDGRRAMRQALPALSAQVRAGGGTADQAATLKQAARVWIDPTVARAVPPSFQRRLAQRHGADAAVLSFAEPEAARAKINQWTAEHTGGRVTELLPAGSIGQSTQVTLTAAVHFRAAWDKRFDAAQTEPRPFQTAAGTQASVPTLNDERAVTQAVVDGTQLYTLPFAAAYDLVLALPAAERSVDALLKDLSGGTLARWRSTLAAPAAKAPRCSFSMPKVAFAPKAASIKASLERLGIKTAFTSKAELRPMLGRASPGSHLDDVLQAAGVAFDEQGGEAVATAAATVKPKSLAVPTACAVDRAFAFVVVHRDTGVPLFIGRVGDPTRSE